MKGQAPYRRHVLMWYLRQVNRLARLFGNWHDALSGHDKRITDKAIADYLKVKCPTIYRENK